jgi:hypothetical protein
MDSEQAWLARVGKASRCNAPGGCECVRTGALAREASGHQQWPDVTRRTLTCEVREAKRQQEGDERGWDGVSGWGERLRGWSAFLSARETSWRDTSDKSTKTKKWVTSTSIVLTNQTDWILATLVQPEVYTPNQKKSHLNQASYTLWTKQSPPGLVHPGQVQSGSNLLARLQEAGNQTHLYDRSEARVLDPIARLEYPASSRSLSSSNSGRARV